VKTDICVVQSTFIGLQANGVPRFLSITDVSEIALLVYEPFYVKRRDLNVQCSVLPMVTHLNVQCSVLPHSWADILVQLVSLIVEAFVSRDYNSAFVG
jgi:hypothetical protein